MGKQIRITSATICELHNKPFYFEAKCFWAWYLRFKDYPSCTFESSIRYMGKTQAEAEEFKEYIISNFQSIGIYNNDKVAIIYDKDAVIAVGKNRCDKWIDVRDKFKIKTFKELNLEFDSLLVACNY